MGKKILDGFGGVTYLDKPKFRICLASANEWRFDPNPHRCTTITKLTDR
jgi:hypothetical protein